jgi:hypothetical protein
MQEPAIVTYETTDLGIRLVFSAGAGPSVDD